MRRYSISGADLLLALASAGLAAATAFVFGVLDSVQVDRLPAPAAPPKPEPTRDTLRAPAGAESKITPLNTKKETH